MLRIALVNETGRQDVKPILLNLCNMMLSFMILEMTFHIKICEMFLQAFVDWLQSFKAYIFCVAGCNILEACLGSVTLILRKIKKKSRNVEIYRRGNVI